jgi:adenylate kinase
VIENIEEIPTVAVVILAPPFGGKSRISRELATNYGFFHLECGKLLDRTVKEREKFPPGVWVQMKNGQLVDDSLVIEVVDEYLPAKLPGKIIFDGFPRSTPQAEWLDNFFKRNQIIAYLVDLKVPDEVLFDRLETQPPDRTYDGEETRGDDNKNTLRSRLDRFNSYGPMIREYFEHRGYESIEIDGRTSVEAVVLEIFAFMEQANERLNVSSFS